MLAAVGAAGQAYAEPPVADGAPAPHVDGAPQVDAAFGHGVKVTSADGRFQMTVGGRLHVRHVTGASSDGADHELALHAIRLMLDGHTFTEDLRYEIQLGLAPDELAGDPTSPVLDAFLEYERWPRAVLRAGQFFVPFDRARMMRERSLQLVERQQVVTELGLDRDVGLTVHSEDVLGTGGHFGYHAGIFQGAGRNRASPRRGLLAVTRLVVRPFGSFVEDEEGDLLRSPRPRLAVGMAGAYSRGAERAQATTGEDYELGAVDYLHGAVDLHFKWQGLSLLAEGIVRRGRRDSWAGTVNGEPSIEWSRSAWGYLVQMGFMVTGRVELAMRWEDLRPVGQTDPELRQLAQQVGRELGFGVNAYLHGHRLKMQGDYLLRYGRSVAEARHEVRLALDVTF
jgi:hypothetical protein